jgi:replicative DNA helicase
MERIETTIISNLIYNEEYCRKVLPFIKTQYFNDKKERVVFETVCEFVVKYGKMITKEILHIELDNRKDISDSELADSNQIVENISDNSSDYQWLLDTTEKWCRDRAIYLALMESIQIADDESEKQNRDAIPHILSEALSVSFDHNIGHDYIKDFESRFEFYHREEEKIPFDLEFFNKITKGGLPNKTLNVALAGTGVGKSLFMCHLASSVLLQNKNVLYITLEMSEEKIAERIDANLLNVNIQSLMNLSHGDFETKITKLSKKTQGKLIIKEYPTASAHSGHFKSLLNELSLKKSFKPDIIFVDYLNICASSRYKGSAVNSYTYVKSIAEELRGLAVENNVPIVSATQTTRSGYGNSDVDLTDTSESFGLPATADLMFAIISSEELENLGQIMIKQLKNRYNDPTIFKRFVIGIDRAKMRLYDVDQSAQKEIVDSGQDLEYNKSSSPVKKSFEEFKF